MPMTDIFVPEGALARPAAAPLTRGRREPNAGIPGPDFDGPTRTLIEVANDRGQSRLFGCP
ncbi:hypothetical protein X888_2481 [Burkholderia pseudomallei MSHR4377]|uniref:hypothetical protein n=1 Tax=Burkholderia pseudomallei TaxID=28450 RepID=UPI000537F141|nr:hypothetical protein [Burkholderia pseudomallei]KGU92931.1 hypothetical protein X888_2481 [Burkholderia pseudomallei MSHR4377]KIX46523.1 hypothetical protein SY87_14190 [Burkholderia pseudomallei]